MANHQQLLISFIRVLIGLVFMYSFLKKLWNIRGFRDTITKFGIIPSKYSNFLAHCFLIGELIVTVFMLLGGFFLIIGFALAAILFLAFSIGLISVLFRKIQTSCSCFGPDENQVSIFHFIRSFGFLICSILGFYFSFIERGSNYALSILEWFLIAAMATVFNILWVNSGEIIRLFTQK